jgi:F-type H+-transporting ATPase subunit delta
MAKNDRSVQSSPISVIYARSLLELANERNSAQEVGEEMKAIGQLMAENPHFKEMLANPSIGQTQRIDLIDKLFKGRASELVYNLIRIANSKGRAAILGEIASTYLKLLDEQLGNVDVQVTTARELDGGQEEAIRQRIGQVLGKNPILHTHVNDAIIGGVVVRVGDKVMDASVKTQLKSMREKLLTSGA